MEYPHFATALNTCFENAGPGGPKNSLALSKISGVHHSSLSRHALGDILPSAEIFGRIVESFPEAHQTLLIRAYMTDCLPSALRHRVRPEITTEKMQEDPTDDIAAISRALQTYSPEHLRDIRYLLERAATIPGIRKALISTANAMRGL